MRMLRRVLAMLVALMLGAAGLLVSVRAEEWLVDRAADRRGRRSLRRLRLAKEAVTAAPEADDATLVRRLTLDLVGRIPTAAEVRAYVESTDPDKRARLVDRLMASPGFVRHQADAFDAMLMAGVKGSLREYLVRAFGENRPWDEVFRELLLADEADAGPQGDGRVPQGAGQGPRPAHQRRQLDLLRRQRQLRQVPRPPAGPGLEAGPFLRDEVVPRPDLHEAATSWASATTARSSSRRPRAWSGRPKFMFLTGRTVEMPGAGGAVGRGAEGGEAAARRGQEEERAAARRRSSAPGRSWSRWRSSPASATSSPGRSSTASGIALRHRAGDAAGPDALGEPAEPSRAARLAGPRHDRARLRPPPADPRPGPEPGLCPRRAAGRRASRPDPRCSPWPRVRPLTPDATGDLDVGGDDRPGEPARRPASPRSSTAKVAALEGRGRSLAAAIARPGERLPDRRLRGAAASATATALDRTSSPTAATAWSAAWRRSTDRREQDRPGRPQRPRRARPTTRSVALLGDYLAHRERPARRGAADSSSGRC